MRTLGIDFGERRVGLAISDPDGHMALPLTTLNRKSDEQLLDEIARLVEEKEVGRLILGWPRNQDGSRNEATRRVESFGRKLERRLGLPVELVDEALTSREAERQLRQSGANLRKHPERIDALAASLLLQEFLDR